MANYRGIKQPTSAYREGADARGRGEVAAANPYTAKGWSGHRNAWRLGWRHAGRTNPSGATRNGGHQWGLSIPVETLQRAGPQIREERRRRGWTQYDLADIAGVSNTTIGEIERAVRPVSEACVTRVFEALGLEMERMEA